MPQIGGDAVLTFDPRDPDKLAEHLTSIVKDSDLRNRLKEAGIARSRMFNAADMAEKTLAVINTVYRS